MTQVNVFFWVGRRGGKGIHSTQRALREWELQMSPKTWTLSAPFSRAQRIARSTKKAPQGPIFRFGGPKGGVPLRKLGFWGGELIFGFRDGAASHRVSNIPGGGRGCAQAMKSKFKNKGAPSAPRRAQTK